MRALLFSVHLATDKIDIILSVDIRSRDGAAPFVFDSIFPRL